MKKIIMIIITAILLNLSAVCVSAEDNRIVYLAGAYEWTAQEPLLYEETSPKILEGLGIVGEEDWNKDTYISTLEALETIDRLCGDQNKGSLRSWYVGDRFSEMDYLDDDTKLLLLRLKDNILTDDDITGLDLDSDITNYKALLYITRLVGDTRGIIMVGDAYHMEKTTDRAADKASVYEFAYEKALISDIDISNADDAIRRDEFYNILHKALFAEYYRGGYDGIWTYRLIDNFLENDDKTVTEEPVKTGPEMVEIPVNVTIKDDLSVRWTLPEEYGFLLKEGYRTGTSVVWKDGTIESRSSGGSPTENYDGDEIINYLMEYSNKECSALRCSYYQPYNWKDGTRYYFDINIFDIDIVIEGDEINPGIYTRFNKSSVAKEISLGDGNTFEKGCYYILKGYETTYRKREYNQARYAVFKAYSNENTLTPMKRGFGVSFFDEIHIQKVTIKKDTNGGYILSITPESTGVFTVVESQLRVW